MKARINWKDPDYTAVYRERAERLARIRANPTLLPGLVAFYAEHPADFITDFGVTTDPRGALLTPPRPVELPFILFKRQRQLVEFIVERIQRRESGLVEKSRDCGASWVTMALACWACLFRPHTAIGVGSAKADLVDRLGDPASLLWKAREFLRNLPPEFRGGWDPKRDSAHMALRFPNGSTIIGQSGDDIGRGARTSVFFLDEAAHIEHDESVDAALTSTSDCVISLSSVRGRDNVFARKRFSGKYPIFTFSWRDDPRKDRAWYERQCATLDPVTRAQEIDIDYSAAVDSILIPSAWIQASIDAAQRLGIEVAGVRRAALDVADEGRDVNAFAGRHGILLERLHTWSGKSSDIYQSVIKAFAYCDQYRYGELIYDADGLGAGVRGDANIINGERHAAGRPVIADEPFRGSAAPVDPLGETVPGRTNADYFANLKAQAWMSLRQRFRSTYRAITEGILPEDLDDLISISSTLPELDQLIVELSLPTYSTTAAGRLLVDKLAGGRSPNRADAVMMCFAPLHLDGGLFDAAIEPEPAADRPVFAVAEVEMPSHCDAVFASVTAALENDPEALAAVFCAISLLNNRNPMISVVDWDLARLGGPMLRTALQRIDSRLAELAHECRARSGSAGIALDPGGMGAVLLADAVERGIPAQSLRTAALELSPIERAVTAAGHVQLGRVRIARPALSKTIEYKGALRNWLLPIAQFNVRQDLREGGPLLLAFSNAIVESTPIEALRRRAS